MANHGEGIAECHGGKHARVLKFSSFLHSPSVAGLGLSRREVRKRVRSLKLQLFWTLVSPGAFSVLGESRTPGTACGGLLRNPWLRELFIRIRSRNPIFPLQRWQGGREGLISERAEKQPPWEPGATLASSCYCVTGIKVRHRKETENYQPATAFFYSVHIIYQPIVSSGRYIFVTVILTTNSLMQHITVNENEKNKTAK